MDSKMAINYQLKLQLHNLIGRTVTHRGASCTVVEVLENEPALVLEVRDSRGSLQDNQYGNPGRRVPEIITIPLFDKEERSKFHPELLQLGLLPCE